VAVDGEVLISVEHDDGVAGIVRDGGFTWLSGYLGEGATRLDGHWSSMEGLTGERSVEGGMLPPGAVDAEVLDRAGRRRRPASANGAWVIVLDEPTIGDVRPVRFLDAEGNTVRRPVPDGWAREHQADHQELCPACGGHTWERIRAPDGSAGMRWSGEGNAPDEPPDTVPEVGVDWEATPWVRCTTCGYAETEGHSSSIMVRFDGALPEDGSPPS
jgi:hypothetical protein